MSDQTSSSPAPRRTNNNHFIFVALGLCLAALVGIGIKLYRMVPGPKAEVHQMVQENSSDDGASNAADEASALELNYHAESGWCAVCSKFVYNATIAGRIFTHREREEAFVKAFAPRPREFRELLKFRSKPSGVYEGWAEGARVGLEIWARFQNDTDGAAIQIHFMEGDSVVTPALYAGYYSGKLQ